MPNGKSFKSFMSAAEMDLEELKLKDGLQAYGVEKLGSGVEEREGFLNELTVTAEEVA